MFAFYVAIGPFGRGPVRSDHCVAEADANALAGAKTFGPKATVRGLSAAQAGPLLAADRKTSATIAALVNFNGAKLDARIAQSYARISARDASRR